MIWDGEHGLADGDASRMGTGYRNAHAPPAYSPQATLEIDLDHVKIDLCLMLDPIQPCPPSERIREGGR